MKIGILTFHWATNYGAVLQTYALQSFLESIGHEVTIINYKPRNFDNSIWRYIINRNFMHHALYCEGLKKESAIVPFREKYLNLTNRVYRLTKITDVTHNLDMVISGSDQVLNPSFLLNGEGRRIPSAAYYLGFSFKGVKVGYAVSFGCTEFPVNALSLAKQNITNFDKIGVREETGIEIVKAMGREDAVLVPDPTLLLGSESYKKLAEDSQAQTPEIYKYCFFIRNIEARKEQLSSFFGDNVLWNNDDANYSLNDWLRKIKNASFVVTDSFHCMVMCLKLHKPFVVVTANKGNVGMNDRFYTLLSPMLLSSRIIYFEDIARLDVMKKELIDWQNVDSYLDLYPSIAEEFLRK